MGNKHMSQDQAEVEVERIAKRAGITPQHLAHGADQLRRAAKRLQQIGEWECNGYPVPGMLTDEGAAKLSEFEARAMQRAADGMTTTFGRDYAERLTLHRKGDPRGCPLIITKAGEDDQLSNRLASFW